MSTIESLAHLLSQTFEILTLKFTHLHCTENKGYQKGAYSIGADLLKFKLTEYLKSCFELPTLTKTM